MLASGFRLLCLGLTVATRCWSFQVGSKQQERRQALFVAGVQENETMESSDRYNGLVLQADAKSKLFASFSALSLGDQYDAVLTGLCAKIVDNNSNTVDDDLYQRLDDTLSLLQEMNQKRIVASPRSMMALIDATVKVQDAPTLAKVMSLSMRNGAITSFGCCMPDIMPLPVSPQTRVKCRDGSVKSRSERLASVAPFPTDERASEVAAALSTLAVAGTCELTDFIPGWESASPLGHFLLGGMIVVGVLDNFYDVIRAASGFAMDQVSKNKNNNDDQTNGYNKNGASAPRMPEKESLPFGLGTGQATGQIVRGLTRLFTIDPARDAMVEASALFVAYTLGLPVFCFRPNALEASVLAVDNRDELLSDTGLLRLLLWLLAPVAAESAQYPVLISSDPREAVGFLNRLEEYALNDPQVAQALWWINEYGDRMELNEQERADLLQWAFTEADVLLRSNRKVVQELAQRLEGGAATIGDCIALLERW
ncbi:hypothetical protein ACA910_005647 [Epithemia clementina (nom. ined.)]